MKKIYYSLAGLMVLALAASCSQEDTLLAEGEGSISVRTSVSTDVEVVSRANESADLASNCLIWISNSKGLVREYNGIDNVPDRINLVTGHYIAEAWAGDSVSASFDKRWFKGRTEFDVTRGQNTPVEINCKVANVVASVKYAEGLEDVLTDFTMTIGHDRGSLTFEGRSELKGYFMMPSTDKNLTYTLKGTQLDGKEFTHTGTIENAKPATEYVLNVKYSAKANEIGGAVFSIIVDETEILVQEQVDIVAAPKIEGYGFDITQAIMAAQGTVGQRSVYVASATQIKSIILMSKAFESIAILGGDDFDILNQNAEGAAAVNEAGISVIDKTNDADKANGKHLLKLVFDEKFTNSLTDGEYPILITATDIEGNVSTATLNIIISDAPVQPLEVDNSTLAMRSATLRGRTSKEVESVGFKYRAVGAAEWISVEASASRSIAADTEFTAVVNDLTPDTEYEYAATTTLANGSEFVGAVMKFTTLDGPQLPNSGMEEWGAIDGVVTLCQNAESMFWDSGNWGSKIAKTTLTESIASPKHSGSFAAQLQTKKVLGLVIAAGNLFTGKFITTEGTDGRLGWGRPFDFSQGQPKALKVWVKYTPTNDVTVNKKYTGNEIAKGDQDRGIIYIALLDDTKVTYEDETWPVIVRTKELENYSFKKDAPNVVAYGEHIFKGATEGNDMIEVTIPIETIRQGVTPSNILVVCSASQFGDYYTGSDKSTMYVDDFKLVY